MKVCSIVCTSGRHSHLESCLWMLLNQDYEGEYDILIYNNSDVKLKLDPIVREYRHHVMLVNNHLDLKTVEKYTNLGAIYRDALTFVPKDTDIVVHSDDDDQYFSNYIKEGAIGFRIAKTLDKEAYKPKYSYYMENNVIKGKVSNVMEPSIFISYDWLKNHGYKETTSNQHLEWFDPLVKENKILVAETGPTTFIYTWGNPIPTFKTSGNPNNPSNFNNYRNNSQDHGDRIIKPVEVKLPIYEK